MPGPGNDQKDGDVIILSNTHGNGDSDSDRMKEVLERCEKLGESGLIIDDNTVYEVDCECLMKLKGRKKKA